MRRALVPVLLVLAGCPVGEHLPGGDAGAGEAVEPCGAFALPDGGVDPALAWPGLRCADLPHLCNLPVESTVREPDTAKALDLVFLPEGFTQDELPAYRTLVQQLVADLEVADGFVARRPKLFNYHRVELVSASTHVSNADRTDTPLAGCVDIANTGNLVADDRLAGLAATANVPDVDAIVVVMNTEVGSPNATPGPFADRPTLVYVNPLTSGPLLIHEFGHALFHLGDEYSSQPACFTPPDLPVFTTADYLLDYPNVSMEQSGAKWSAIHTGAVAGGMDFRHCVYSPGLPCLMNEGTLPFCPVCSTAVDQTLDAREGKDDGPPRCAVELDQEPTFVHGTLTIRVATFDRNAPTSWTLDLAGGQLAKGTVSHWWGRATHVLDSRSKPNGDYALTVKCQDGLGTAGSAQVTVKIRN